MTSAAAPLPPIDTDLLLLAGTLLERLRAQGTRVHAITNAAAQTLTANLLLAAGAVPSLTAAPAEVASFTRGAGSLLVNLGTLDEDRRLAIPLAIEAAEAAGKPWVLDPVFCNASPARLAFARSLLERRPGILRCNAHELAALAETEPTLQAVSAFARAHGTVVALTGATDVVSDGPSVLRIHGGHPLMARVTAMGCAATALVAAFAALHERPLEAAAAALLVVSVAGQVAGETAAGPGSFQPGFLDALYGLTAAELISRGSYA